MGQQSSKLDRSSSPVELTRCGACNTPLRDHEMRNILNCGHRFCFKCKEEHYKSLGDVKGSKGMIQCPVCFEVTLSETTDDSDQSEDVATIPPAPKGQSGDYSDKPNDEKHLSVEMKDDQGTLSAEITAVDNVNVESATDMKEDKSEISNEPAKVPSPKKIPLDHVDKAKSVVPCEVMPPATTTSPKKTEDLVNDEVRISKKRPFSDVDDVTSGSDEDMFQDSQEYINVRSPPSTRDDSMTCAICKNSKVKRRRSEASFYCLDCINLLCGSCKENHNLRPRCKSHVVVAVTETTLKDLTCQEHQLLVEDYCIGCKVVTCADCHVTTHREHNIRSFTTQPLDTGMFANLDERSAQNLSLQEVLDGTETEYQREIKHTKEVMIKCRNDMIGTIHSCFENMFSKIDEEAVQWNDKLNSTKRDVATEDSLLEQLRDKCNRLVSPIAGIPDLHIANAQDLLGDMKKQLPTSTHHIDQPATYIYIPNENMEPKCGQIVTVPHTQMKVHSSPQKICKW